MFSSVVIHMIQRQFLQSVLATERTLPTISIQHALAKPVHVIGLPLRSFPSMGPSALPDRLSMNLWMQGPASPLSCVPGLFFVLSFASRLGLKLVTRD